MFSNIDFLQHIPEETHKSVNINKLATALTDIFNEFDYELNTRRTNFTILQNLEDGQLERFGQRYGAVRVEKWTDEDLKKRVKMLWRFYNAEKNVLGNIHELLTESTGFFSEVRTSALGISGEIDVKIFVPQGESTLPFEDLQNFWIAGCKINPTISDDLKFGIFDSFGDLSDDKYLTGIDALVPTFKDFQQ